MTRRTSLATLLLSFLILAAGCFGTDSDGSTGDGGSGSGFRGFIASFDTAAGAVCACMVEAGEFVSQEACMAEVAGLGGLDMTCAESVAREHPEANGSFACFSTAYRNYATCQRAAGCATPTFVCTDGSEIPADWECDGEPDCAGGEDEADCPGPFACGDGQTVPGGFVCDGERDCANGSDEAQNCVLDCDTQAGLEIEACDQAALDVLDAIELTCR